MLKTIVLFTIMTVLLNASSIEDKQFISNDTVMKIANNQMPYIVYGFKSLGFSRNQVNNECKIIHESIFYQSSLSPEQKMYVYNRCMEIVKKFYGAN